MGHIVFIFLHFLAIAFGIIGLFLTAPLHLIYSAASKRPVKQRADGKKPVSGMFGYVIDDIETELTMRDCPYCLKQIMKAATRCPYCQSDVEEVLITEDEKKAAGWKKFFYYVACGAAVLLVLSIFMK